jgi:hypothetical protein
MPDVVSPFGVSSFFLYSAKKPPRKAQVQQTAEQNYPLQYSVGKRVILGFGSLVSSEHVRLKLDSVDRLQY